MVLCLEPELVLPGDLSLTKEAAPREAAEEEGQDGVGGGTQELHHLRRRRRRRGVAIGLFLLLASMLDTE